jgi:hypothetical protein
MQFVHNGVSLGRASSLLNTTCAHIEVAATRPSIGALQRNNNLKKQRTKGQCPSPEQRSGSGQALVEAVACSAGHF